VIDAGSALVDTQNNIIMFKFRFSVAFILAMGALVSALAGDSNSPSISEVTVYPDRARVTRIVATEVASGSSVQEFGGFPEGLDVNSLEASGKSDSNVTIEGVDLRDENLAASANPRVQEVEQELQKLHEEKNALAGEKSVLNERRLFFTNLSASIGKGEKGAPGLDEIRQLYSYYGDELGKISESILAVEQNERKLDPQIDRVRRELEGLQGAAKKVQKKVLLSVKAIEAAKAEFIIRYLVQGAGWMPSYDARVDVNGGKVAIQYDAQVHQETGEDWNNVSLVLSTARPSVAGQMPELEPSIVDYRPEMPPPAPVAFGAQRSAIVAPPEASPKQAKMDVSQATIEERGLSVSYRVGPKVIIPSDGQPHRANVALIQLQGKTEYVTTPKLDSALFLKLHLTNSSDTPLLPGPTNIFREGEFVGNASMMLVQSGSEFDLYAGRDDAIKVERKELVNKRSESGMINRKTLAERRYQITLQNFRTIPINVAVSDQLPVSANVEIVVTQTNFSVQPASIDKTTGKIIWNIDLNPKDKKVIEFGYSLEWPKGKEIEGS
jgi:uncharacterized protein (TIGR02231 family)